MEIRQERQRNEIADQVEAKIAIMRPVLASVLQSLSAEVVKGTGHDPTSLSRGEIPLHLLGRLRARGDGDLGIAFEYAIHDAVRSGFPAVIERVSDALDKCRIKTDSPSSIFFAIEKSGSEQVISTDLELITASSKVLSGKAGRPVYLKTYLSQLSAAFRRASTRPNLPQSIRGLWKADLFLGSPARDHWVGTSIKTNPRDLEGASGLRIGIVPTKSGVSDAVRMDDHRGLVVCPIPHDDSFMQLFYEVWRIAQALMTTDFQMPRESLLPNPVDREVARVFAERRMYSVAVVIQDTEAFAQPLLLETNSIQVGQLGLRETGPASTTTLVVPQPRGLQK